MERVGSIGSIIWGHRQGASRNRLDGSRCISPEQSFHKNEDDDKGTRQSESSSGYRGDVDSKDSSLQCQTTKTYSRRFYILFVFSVTSFMQYCCWNSFGPISSTCMVVFEWSEAEIAFMASLDPFTYVLTMLIFSWMMDVKGLRISMIVTAFFMAFGTGLRLVTSDKRHVTWTMASGQFFNGLAGPVTQAAPTLLSNNWFPVNERTTATAVASLCGSLGIAMSFIIGPTLVRDIDAKRYVYVDPHHNTSIAVRDGDALSPRTPRSLADSTYRDAKYYWPFDNELKFSHRHTRDDTEIFQEYKNKYHGRAVGQVIRSPGILGDGVTTIAKKGWVNLGDFENECLGKPSLCKQGLSVSFWVSFANNATKQFLLGTGGLKTRRNGFLISVKKNEKQRHIATMKVDLIAKKRSWKLSFSTYPQSWIHVTITWNRTEGLHAYINGSFVTHKKQSSPLNYRSIKGKSFTVGRVNNAKRYSSASFDEIILWEKKLEPQEVRSTFRNGFNREMSLAEQALLNDYNKAKDDSKKDIMRLLFIEFGVNAVIFILILLYFPDKPPTPPSKSVYVTRVDFSSGFKQLFRSPAFWTLCLIYGITTGVYSGWGSLLNVNLSTFGISQKEAGWLGFYAIIAGICAGMILARLADLFTGRMKALLILLFIGASGCFLWFCMLCLRIIIYSRDSLYKSAILGGFFISGTIPLFYELTMEQMYPIADGVTIGLMTLVNNIVTVLFLSVLMIPNIGTLWMNWALFGSCIVCLPVLFLFREQYNRLSVDMEAKNILELSDNMLDLPEKEEKRDKTDESYFSDESVSMMNTKNLSKSNKGSLHSLSERTREKFKTKLYNVNGDRLIKKVLST